jgi:hypothetical protein
MRRNDDDGISDKELRKIAEAHLLPTCGKEQPKMTRALIRNLSIVLAFAATTAAAWAGEG